MSKSAGWAPASGFFARRVGAFLTSRQRFLAGLVAVCVGIVFVRAFWLQGSAATPSNFVLPTGTVDADTAADAPAEGVRLGSSPEPKCPTAPADAIGADVAPRQGEREADFGIGMPPEFRLWTAWRALYEYCKYPTACVKAATTDSLRTVFVGLSKYGPRSPARVGDRIVFGIQARDSNGVNRACGGDGFRIEIRGPSIHVGHPVDNLDGTYSFAARLFDEGVYRVYARLDYRACESLSWCQRNRPYILIEWIGGDDAEAPEIVVSGRGDMDALRLPPPPDASALLGGPCPVNGRDAMYYRRWMPFDDPALRVGRWRPRGEACADPSFPGKWRCKVASHRPAEAFVWHPVVSDRPTMDDLVPRLRNVWLHSIGDSLNRNLYGYMANFATTLPEFGPAEISCYRMRMPDLANVTDAFVVDSPLECGAGRFSKTLPTYVEFVKVTHFPRVNVTFSYHLISELTERTEYVPQRDGFKMWTNAAFLKQLRGPRWWPKSAGGGADTILNETLPAPHVKASRAFAYPLVQDESVVPTHVLFNIGLHYVSTVKDLDNFPALMRKVIDLVRVEFPASRTRLIWRSTAQTQYDNRTLPAIHACRTFQRVMLVNEISAEMVGDAGIPVVDFLQYSFGRGDAAPDNRHYGPGVEYEVASELLNLVFECPSPLQEKLVEDGPD